MLKAECRILYAILAHKCIYVLDDKIAIADNRERALFLCYKIIPVSLIQ